MTTLAGLVLTLLVASCRPVVTDSMAPHHRHPAPLPDSLAARRTVPEGASAPLFGDLGSHHRPIATTSKLAQRYFDQGLVLTYGFNHAEAARSFREAQRLDPGCAMCFWGEAYVLGPNINKPMDDTDVPVAWAALGKARAAAAKAAPVERALIEALGRRYVEEPVADRAPLDRAYADAMRDVARRFPDDLDVQTLFAEALLDTMPWDYYEAPDRPKTETVEATTTLESVMRRSPDHPGAIHYYIHAIEPSTTPERAEAGADRLRTLVPGAGHLVHMPAHIYLRVGRYHDASVANERAAAADESYITQCRAQGFYPAAYYPHNLHFLWTAATFEGRSGVAQEAAEKLVGLIPAEMIDELPPLEEFVPTATFSRVRFGAWDDVLAEPAPDPKRRYATGIWHYARGMAFTAKGRRADAERELRRLRTLASDRALADLEFFSFARAGQLLGIAADVLEGRLAARRGRWSEAVAAFERAATAQDALRYTEPPPWHFPVRDALGWALLGAGRAEDAVRVYRQQLAKTPRSGWTLIGLTQALRATEREAEAARAAAAFRDAWQRADIQIEASVL